MRSRLPQRGAVQIALPEPHAGQVRVRSEARRFNWLCAGRRWRKTTLMMALNAEAAVYGGEYIWGAPTFKQVRVGWDEMKRACATAVDFNESKMMATFPGGSRIHYISLEDPDNARGLTADGVVVDEAAEVSRRAWHEVLRAMLMDTGGWAWFPFTPKGRNWVWEEWMLAHSGEDPESMAWQIPSLGCRIEDGKLVRAPHPYENPHIPFAELQSMFERMPERTFRQEVLAEFLDDAGGVFRNVRGCIDPRSHLEDGPPHRMAQYVMGVDLAKHQDYTVVCVADVQARRLVAFDRWNEADWGLTKARIAEMAKRWNDAVVWMDATGVGDPVYDDLKRGGLRIHPYTLTSTSKQVLIENAVLMVEQQRVAFPNVRALVDELEAYQYVTSAAGNLKMSAPEGLHDDAVIAFALMCWPLARVSGSLSQSAMEALYGATGAATRTSDFGGLGIMRKQF